jgi:hypothetical protein
VIASRAREPGACPPLAAPVPLVPQPREQRLGLILPAAH